MAKTLTFLEWVLRFLDRKYPLPKPKPLVRVTRDLRKAS